MIYKRLTAWLKGRRRNRALGDGGFSLIETLFAMTFLSIGLLAMAQMIPLASSQLVQSQRHTVATETAQLVLEELSQLPFGDAALTAGTHTTTVDNQTVEYVVTDNDPVPGAKRVDLSVSWSAPGGAKTITYNTILRR